MRSAATYAQLADALETNARHGGGAARWLNDPVGFAEHCFDWPDGQQLVAYQRDIMGQLTEHHREAVRGPHGLGKTTTAAILVHWFALTRDAAGIDWKVPTTASAWRQLEKYLWPEIHKWAARIRWDQVGRPAYDERRELLDLSLQLRYGEAFAAAAADPAKIEGAHADHVLVIVDEAKTVPPDLWDALEGAFSGATAGREAYVLAQSTPGEPQGRFYEIHTRRPGLEDWRAIHVTLEQAIAAGRVSAQWAEQRATQWGETTAVYANRVLGEFHSSDEDATIPLAWVEQANERWHVWDKAGRPVQPGRLIVGVDVARFGTAQTVRAIRQGPVVETLEHTAREDTMSTAERVASLLRNVPASFAVVDTDGLGAGVTDRLRQLRLSVQSFHGGERSARRDRSGELGFVNVRSAAWWNVRELLDPRHGPTLALPPDDLLTGDLTAPRWRVVGGRIEVEPKDRLVKRLGRSTDTGDAVAMACWPDGSPLQPAEFAGAVPYGSTFHEYAAVPWQ